MSEEFRARATTTRLVAPVKPAENHLELPVAEWIKHRVESEPYWFQRVEVFPGYFSPGWDDPAENKLPYYGLPEDLSGLRVLDIGCAEGFFAFEAERRGAREVIGIDSFPDSVRRFGIVKEARQSSANAFLMNVYDLEPKRLGTFDLVLFYGVFYHLKHPQLALERILSICTGTLLFQTHVFEEPAVQEIPSGLVHRPWVVQKVGARGAERENAVDGGPERACVRDARRLAADDDVVVVAVKERPLGLRERTDGVGAEPLQRSRGVPDLDDRRLGPVRGDVDRQVRVVHDEQPRAAELVHPPDDAREVGELAAEPVRVGLEDVHVFEVRVPAAHRRVELREVAVEVIHARRRQNDAPASDRQSVEQQTEQPQQERREAVLEDGHGPARTGSVRLVPPRVRPTSRPRPGGRGA